MRKYYPFISALLVFSACVQRAKPEMPVGMNLELQEKPYPRTIEPEGEIQLAHALLLTLEHHPQIQAKGDLDRLRKALVREARVVPNPRVELSVEDFLGSGPYRHVKGSTWTVQVSQVLELGGKREARVALAESEWNEQAANFAIMRLHLLSRVTLDFVQSLYLQKKLEHVRMVYEHARNLEKALILRVEGGRESHLQLRQYQLNLRLLQHQQQRVERQCESARKMLSTNWGNPEPKFRAVSGSFADPANLPSADILIQKLKTHPEIKRRQAQLAHFQARIREEQAKVKPDPEFHLGVRYLAEDRNAALVGGISVPLSLWDRRKEAVEVLQVRMGLAQRELAAHLALQEMELVKKLEEYGQLSGELQFLKKTILPELDANIALFREGFSLGRFTLLEMLDSQKSTFELKERMLDLQSALQTLIVELEFLTGMQFRKEGFQ